MYRSPAVIGYYTMVRKEFVRIVRIWSQTLLPPVITTSLYFAIFGTFIGSQVAAIQGHSYIQFIVPGLVMMAIITSSYSNTVSTFFFSKFLRTIDSLLVSPMPTWVVISGFVTGGLMRALLVGVLVVLVSLLFTQDKSKFDAGILATFIKMMGVYPAGSTVQLTDDRYAMVVGVNSSRPLKPRVLVHEAGVACDDALILDLETAPGLGIRRCIKPLQLPAAVFDYLAPRQKVAYFFEPATRVPHAA